MHIEENFIGSQYIKNVQDAEVMLNRVPFALAIVCFKGEAQYINNAFLKLLESVPEDNKGFCILSEKYWKSFKDLKNAFNITLKKGHWQGNLVTFGGIDTFFYFSLFEEDREGYVQMVAQLAHNKKETATDNTQKTHIREMRILFESVPDGVAIGDINNPTKFLYVNQNFCTITGYQKDELVLKPNTVKKLYGSAASDIKLSQRLDTAFQFKKKLLHDVVLNHPEGRSVFCDIHSSFIEIHGKKYLANYFHDVSDRREAVSRLSEFDDEINLTQELTRSGTMRWDIATGEVEWSEGFYKLLQIENEEKKPANKVFFDCIIEEDRGRVLEILDDSINRLSSFEIFFRIYISSQNIHAVKMSGNLVEDLQNGTPVLTAILQDANDLSDVQQKLNRSEGIRRKSESISKTGFWEMEIANNKITWSEQVFNLCELDTKLENFSRVDFHGLVHPRDKTKLTESFQEAVQNGKPFSEEYRIVLQDDSIKYFQEKVEIIKNRDGVALVLNGTIQDITIHKIAEKELKYQQYLLQNVNDAIISTNIRLEIKSWNKAAQEVYGWSKEEVLGKKVKEVLDSKDTQQVSMENVLKQVMKTGYWKGDLKQRTKFGKEVIVQSSSRLLRDDNGFPLGIATVNRDITAFTKVEEQALKSQRMLELIFDSIPGWIFWENKEGVIQGCNKHFALAMGKKNNEEIIGKSLEDLITDEVFLSNAKRTTNEVLENKSEHFHIIESLRMSDSLKWLDVNRLPLRDQESNIIGVMCTMEDITEKKEIEAQLKENQATLASVIENTDDLIWYVDRKHKFQAFNSAVSEKVKEVLKEDIKVGDDFFSILTPDYRKAFRDFHEEVLEGKKLTREYCFEQRIGLPFWFEFSGNPIFNDNRMTGACYIARDVTVRKQQEQLILDSKLGKERELSLAVIQGQEEERKRISMELHDGVCQTLTALQMQANYLEDTKGSNIEHQLSPLVRIIQLADHAEMEVRRISSNLMPSVLTDFGLPEAVSHLCNLIFRDSNIAFDIDILLNGKRFSNTIEVGVFRIVQEVLNNTYKHSGATQIEITLIDEGSRIFISIKDNGKGFSQEEMNEKRKYRNGLNNLSQRVSLLGGTIEIESVSGNGCQIIVYIPYGNKAIIE